MNTETKMIGICGVNLFNQQPIQFIQALQKESQKYNYCITTFCCSADNSYYPFNLNSIDNTCNEQLVELIRHVYFRGMIIFANTIKNPSLIQLIMDICTEKKIPVFCIEGKLDGAYCMKFDNLSGFENIVRHVVEHHGCRKINMIAGPNEDINSEQKVNIYKKVLLENNIPIEPERITYGDSSESSAKKVVQEILNNPLSMPEAIICGNDAIAISTCDELHNAGFTIPDDLIVTGFEGTQTGQYYVPALSTCVPDFVSVNRFILEEIERYHNHEACKPFDYTIPYVPLINQSCGCKQVSLSNLNHIVSSLCKNSSDSAWHNITMNQLVTANYHNSDIMDLANMLLEYAHLWNDHFRFSFVKASLLHSYEVPDGLTDMVTLLDVGENSHQKPGKILALKDLIDYINSKIDNDILIVTILCSDITVYGYNIEGYKKIDERKMLRCKDFTFFLSYCLNTILYNNINKELTTGLINANLEISTMALQDSMTGLYNRQGFYKAIEPLLDMEFNLGKLLYIFSIDMNSLKYINDTFGHADGDFAITTLGHAIQNVTGDLAISARFGGDEFVVAVISERENAYTAAEFSKNLEKCITITNGLSQKPYPVEASVGMICLPITRDMNLENMIAIADKAMYKMKKKSRK